MKVRYDFQEVTSVKTGCSSEYDTMKYAHDNFTLRVKEEQTQL